MRGRSASRPARRGGTAAGRATELGPHFIFNALTCDELPHGLRVPKQRYTILLFQIALERFYRFGSLSVLYV